MVSIKRAHFEETENRAVGEEGDLGIPYTPKEKVQATFLGEELDMMVQMYLPEESDQRRSSSINNNTIAATRSILKTCDRLMLDENGGHNEVKVDGIFTSASSKLCPKEGYARQPKANLLFQNLVN